MKKFFVAALFCSSAFGAVVSTSVHPSWNLINLRPGNFQPSVGGMDFLSDGRLVIGHWGGSRVASSSGGVGVMGLGIGTNTAGIRQYGGMVFILSGVTGDNPAPVIDTFATGLEDPMGLVVVRDTIYVAGGNNIIRLVDNNNDGKADRKDTIFTLPGTPLSGSDSLHPMKGRSEWMYGMVARNDTFYVTPSSLNDASDTKQINPYRGTLIAVTRGNGIRGNFKIVSMGLRHPEGTSAGPNGTLWTSDVQGNWLPNNKLINLQPGKFYGYKHTPSETWDNMPETPAAVFLPQDAASGVAGTIANCPAGPIYITSGPYAGQFFMGDVLWGGIQRFFIEKNSLGDYQGAVFAFTSVKTGQDSGGVHRMVWGPDGALYVGEIGTTGGDWSFHGGSQYWGLKKLKYKGDTTFEMLAVRSRHTSLDSGMEIEFTKPVDSASAILNTSYLIQTSNYTPSSAYGGLPQNTKTLTPAKILVSSDRRKVFLSLPGLVVRGAAPDQRVVYIKLLNVKSSGTSPWTSEAWYTLNAFGTGGAFDPPTGIDPAVARSGLLNHLQCRLQGENIAVKIPFQGNYELRISDLRGSILSSIHGHGSEEHALSLRGMHGRFVVVEAYGDGMNLRRTIMVP